ncbi:hypothetical protein CHH28_02215 [Bacterioplanes sanyensis]|uniref:Uncharacterized protein n=1 Tax=Bacterioplanes sanyensis TaxID=1249553 RepID=A0A222FFN3_9GAMM|nr:hypothetical protein [Bacterioplanes sanyensis]ASP37559.1 hypothetical protein CHH28_02215 [Bacterioplanes sanyensis]
MPDPAPTLTAQPITLANAGTWMKTRQKRLPSADLLQHYDIQQAELRAYKAQVLQQENKARIEAGLPPIELESNTVEHRSMRRISSACYMALTVLALCAVGIIVPFV